jgi:hypothetical protein
MKKTKEYYLKGIEVYKEEFENAIKEYSCDNWGGEEEIGLTEETIKNAKTFNTNLEYFDDLHEISITNDGQISLEWIVGNFLNIIRINKFGVIFIKTHKNNISNSDEILKSISFSNKDTIEIKRSMWKISKDVNDKVSI